MCDVRVGDRGWYSCVLSEGSVERDREDFVLTVTTDDGKQKILLIGFTIQVLNCSH